MTFLKGCDRTVRVMVTLSLIYGLWLSSSHRRRFVICVPPVLSYWLSCLGIAGIITQIMRFCFIAMGGIGYEYVHKFKNGIWATLFPALLVHALSDCLIKTCVEQNYNYSGIWYCFKKCLNEKQVKNNKIVKNCASFIHMNLLKTFQKL